MRIEPVPGDHHCVGIREGLIDDLGRIAPTFVNRLWPRSPIALCGVSLVSQEGQVPPEDTGRNCPICFRSGSTVQLTE